MSGRSEVGYGKPPREHRFKPGQSGNPRGRPKGARGFKADVEEALRATIVITEDGKQRRITIVAAALKRLIQKAVQKGDLRAIETLFTLARQQDATAPSEAAMPDADDRALLADYMRRQAERIVHD